MQISWPDTKITKLLNIKFPIIQAPMAGGATTPELIAAVSNAGGLGSLGAGYLSAKEIRKTIKQIRELTDKPFSVNLFMPEAYQATKVQIELARRTIQDVCRELEINIDAVAPPYAPPFEDQMNVIIEEKIPVFSFTFGIPSLRWLQQLKERHIIILGTATSIEEAVLLEQNSVDAVVVQGVEAGGHRGTFLGKAEDNLNTLSELLAGTLKQVHIPVIAAGGIMNATGIYSAMQLGAAAVQMGTAFLCCPESGIHPVYKEAILNTQSDLTTLTRAFSGKTARGLINKFILRMQAHENTIVNYPIQKALTAPLRKEAGKKNMPEFMSMWAGQGVHLSKVLPAADLIQEWNDDVLAIINDQ